MTKAHRSIRRDLDRGNAFIRQWRVIVLLRRGARTIPDLARILGCSERTVRRDLYALQAVPLPIESLRPMTEDGVYLPNREPNVWRMRPCEHWPRGETLPTRELELV